MNPPFHTSGPHLVLVTFRQGGAVQAPDVPEGDGEARGVTAGTWCRAPASHLGAGGGGLRPIIVPQQPPPFLLTTVQLWLCPPSPRGSSIMP